MFKQFSVVGLKMVDIFYMQVSCIFDPCLVVSGLVNVIKIFKEK